MTEHSELIARIQRVVDQYKRIPDSHIGQVASVLLEHLKQESAAPVAEPFRLQVGKWYRARNGEVVGPLSKQCGDTKWPYYARVADGITRSWTPEGRQAYKASDDSPYDLLCEVPAPTPTPAPELPFTLQLGKRYISRSGGVYGPLEKGFDPNYPFCVALHSGGTRTWRADGRWSIVEESSDDLVKEYKDGMDAFAKASEFAICQLQSTPVKMIDVWINEYPDRIGASRTSRDEADQRASVDRIGRHHIVLKSGTWDE